MRVIQSVIVVLSLALPSLVNAGQITTPLTPAVSEFQKVADFISAHLVGHSFKTKAPVKSIVKVNGVDHSMEYYRKVRFSNLTLTKTGLIFDMISEAEYTFAVNGQAKPEDKDERKMTWHYELQNQVTTSDVQGFLRVSKDSDHSSTGEAYSILANVSPEGELVIGDNLIGFADQTLDGGKTFFPGTSSSVMKFKYDPASKLTTFDQSFMFYEIHINTEDKLNPYTPIPLKAADGKDMSPILVPSIEN